jgi:hypothetical protein
VVGLRFKDIFEYLEAQGYLDIDDPLDIWVLHRIFIPIISRSLKTFQATWDFHRSSSAHEEAPIRRYMEGLALRPVQDEYPIAYVDNDFGIDPEVTNPVELAAQEVDHDNDLDNLPSPSQNCTISEIELAADRVAS